jgi:hypothetical protein
VRRGAKQHTIKRKNADADTSGVAPVADENDDDDDVTLAHVDDEASKMSSRERKKHRKFEKKRVATLNRIMKRTEQRAMADATNATANASQRQHE